MLESLLVASVATIALALVVAVAFALPAIRQMRRTAAQIEALTVKMGVEFMPLAEEARQTLSEIRQGAAAMETIAARLDEARRALDQVARWTAGMRAAVRETMAPPVATVAGVAEGIREAFRVLLQRGTPGSQSPGSHRDSR